MKKERLRLYNVEYCYRQMCGWKITNKNKKLKYDTMLVRCYSWNEAFDIVEDFVQKTYFGVCPYQGGISDIEEIPTTEVKDEPELS